MTDDSSTHTFSQRSIDDEPAGATPIDADDLRGLIPDFVATRDDLNRVEFDNIARALPWGTRQARTIGPLNLLDFG